MRRQAKNIKTADMCGAVNLSLTASDALMAVIKAVLKVSVSRRQSCDLFCLIRTKVWIIKTSEIPLPMTAYLLTGAKVNLLSNK